MSIPGRELLVCLIVVLAGAELHGGAESRTTDESSRSLDAGPRQLGSSEKAGRADGARRETEDGDGRHGEGGVDGEVEVTN